MKNRIISACIALLVLIPVTLKGGIIFNIVVYIISLLGLKELLDTISKKKEIPFIMSLLSYIFVSLIILVDVSSVNIVYSLDYRILSALFLLFLIPTVLYHDKKKYSIVDAFYMIGSILFLGIAMALLIMLRAYDLKLFIFLLTITIITDTFAYISDYLIGKHKLCKNLLPDKSVEGLIIGLVMGTFVSSMFYYTCINSEINIYLLLSMCIILSLIGQLGDLVFSAIKKHFGINKFGNIFPGHGGVLDRLDSIMFVILGFVFFITLI